MEHVEAERLVPLYADNELDAMTAGRLEDHVRACDICGPKLGILKRNHDVLSCALGRERAPQSLIDRVLADIDATLVPITLPRPVMANWMRYAATVVATAALASAATYAIDRPDRIPALAATVINDHMRALDTHRVIDVSATDDREIGAWFRGRLNYAPPFSMSASRDLPLIGARIDYIDGAPVAAYVYGRGRHLVSVFVRPVLNNTKTTPASAVRQGFGCVHWGSKGFEYWAVADLPVRELQSLREAFAA